MWFILTLAKYYVYDINCSPTPETPDIAFLMQSIRAAVVIKLHIRMV